MVKLVRNFSVIFTLMLLSGCEFKLFDPKGPIAEVQMDLIIITTLIMLIVVVPVTIMGIWFPYRYRKNNTKHEYNPDWEHSTKIEIVVWAIPILIVIVLGVITYVTSFSVDPRKPIQSENKPIVIQVVAMDWKWLFIYPEQEFATVNEIAIPVNTPVEFLVTSDTVMNSFFIPNIGSQIYAMSGMENRLNLMATEEGEYKGFSSHYSGFGFSGMKFTATAKTETAFNQWVSQIKALDKPLDDTRLENLRVKSKDVQPIYFSSVNPLLFNEIIEKYAGALNVR